MENEIRNLRTERRLSQQQLGEAMDVSRQTINSIEKERWWMPGLSVVIGLLILAAFWIGGSLRDGLGGLAVMTAVGALFLLGSRSETLRGIGGPGRDERWAKIDVHATAIAGMVLLLVVMGAWLYEIAQGEDGRPYALLAAETVI